MKYLIIIPAILITLSINAQYSQNSNSIPIKKQYGYGLELLGFSYIVYSNINVHIKSKELRETYYFNTSYEKHLDLEITKGFTSNYALNYHDLEKRNLVNSFIGSTLLLSGIILNNNSSVINSKYKRK